MEDEDCYYRTESEVEADSDHEDQDSEQELGQWLGQLETLKMVSKFKVKWTQRILMFYADYGIQDYCRT